MATPFWEQAGYMFTTQMDGESERYEASNGTLAHLYEIWASLTDEERETANIRLEDRTLLEAKEIAQLAQRADLPTRFRSESYQNWRPKLQLSDSRPRDHK